MPSTQLSARGAGRRVPRGASGPSASAPPGGAARRRRSRPDRSPGRSGCEWSPSARAPAPPPRSAPMDHGGDDRHARFAGEYERSLLEREQLPVPGAGPLRKEDHRAPLAPQLLPGSAAARRSPSAGRTGRWRCGRPPSTPGRRRGSSSAPSFRRRRTAPAARPPPRERRKTEEWLQTRTCGASHRTSNPSVSDHPRAAGPQDGAAPALRRAQVERAPHPEQGTAQRQEPEEEGREDDDDCHPERPDHELSSKCWYPPSPSGTRPPSPSRQNTPAPDSTTPTRVRRSPSSRSNPARTSSTLPASEVKQSS
jgi:hypothetical protein